MIGVRSSFAIVSECICACVLCGAVELWICILFITFIVIVVSNINDRVKWNSGISFFFFGKHFNFSRVYILTHLHQSLIASFFFVLSLQSGDEKAKCCAISVSIRS